MITDTHAKCIEVIEVDLNIRVPIKPHSDNSSAGVQSGIGIPDVDHCARRRCEYWLIHIPVARRANLVPICRVVVGSAPMGE